MIGSRFRTITTAYYRACHSILFCFDPRKFLSLIHRCPSLLRFIDPFRCIGDRESFQAAQDHVKAARLAVRVSAIIQFVRQLQR
jgi:GTPase SAR1 family protein